MTTRKMLTQLSDNNAAVSKVGSWLFWLAVFVATLAAGPNAHAAAPSCDRTITADVVVFDNPTIFNRLGAQNPNWISYALRRDVIYMHRDQPTDSLNGKPLSSDEVQAFVAGGGSLAGRVELRPDKRPRPLVLRSVAGACLDIHFQNLLAPVANPNNPIQGEGTASTDPTWKGLFNDDQVAGRCAGIHAQGVELREVTKDDGSMVGNNHPDDNTGFNCGVGEKAGGLVGPNASITYKLYTPAEGAFIFNNYGAQLGSEANSGNTAVGMFGALNVQPKHARIYRSQVTEEEMRLATVGTVASDCGAGDIVGVDCNPGGQPILDYEKLYPDIEPWKSEGKAGLPVLNMLTASGELVHSDINAIIAGPDADGSWRSVCNGSVGSPATDCPYPLESVGKNNPQLPNRIEAFREFTSQFHDEQTNSQVFPRWYNDPVLGFTLAGVKDQFMINYGSGGIGSEIIANRLHAGPMHDCTDCAYEEFFLSATTVGDPALLVNTPANSGIEQCDPSNIAAGPLSPNACWRDANLANGPIDGNYALYQEDPANVHTAYIGDYTKIRNTHAGSFEQHIFHLHNQQWLFNPNDDNANYLDAQEIMPGSGHTYELVNGGAGNRNRTSGDAIFHCHFYPHFAQGMWYHIRIMDVFEKGSLLAVSTADGAKSDINGDGIPDNDANGDGYHDQTWALRSGQPAAGTRAHGDGELPDGVPIPAVVPLPGKAMPHMPADVEIVAVDRGGFSLLGGRTPPDGKFDSSQALVDLASVAGADGILHTRDDVSPGYPFFIAGYECGVPTADDPCPTGVIGQRFPTPPLDMLTEAGVASLKASNSWGLFDNASTGQAGGWNGGLPRHALLGYTSGGWSKDTQNRLDFQKVIKMAKPVYYPEIGTDIERVAMIWHSERTRRSAVRMLDDPTATVSTGVFMMNGAKPVPGGPFQDPCIDDRGKPVAGTGNVWFDGDGNASTMNTTGSSNFTSQNPRTYKVANIQIDAVFNKVGYHYPQERIISLWEDVDAHVKKLRPPEPLVMRFNTFDCGRILHSNLVPHEYELDDFQVRTPTDIIGQHIHLPKWDLTTNDGAANGWNYEDGALAPGMVRERIEAINRYNELAGQVVTVADIHPDLASAKYPLGGVVTNLSDLQPVATIDSGDAGDEVGPNKTHLEALPHPFFGNGPAQCGDTVAAGNQNPQCAMYVGARTVIQRILVDPVVNVAGVDRGLGLTFSHDHYGPSTFQQIGLYSTILAEPAGSTWKHNESGVPLATRADGGPTSWQAAILPPAAAPNGSNVKSETIKPHREFYFEMSDFQHAYEPGMYVGADADGIPIHAHIDQPDPFDATRADAPALNDTWKRAVNPPLKLKSVPFPDIVTANNTCPGPRDATGDGVPDVDQNGNVIMTNQSPFVLRPCVEAINISHSSMWVVNYRNEPVSLRVFDPDKMGPDGQNGAQADGDKGDLALAFQSRTDREIPQLNTSLGDTPYPTPSYCGQNGNGDGINCDRNPGDPFTPIMRAYEHDEIKVKIQVGATEEQHQTTVHGLKWLSNGSGFGRAPNSGWRNFQSHGISEQFSLQVPVIPDRNQRGNRVDYLYAQDATRDGIWSGTWGLIRSYANKQSDLYELPATDISAGDVKLSDESNFNGVCPKYEMNADGSLVMDGKGRNATPKSVPLRVYDVAAVLANKVLPNKLGVTIPANVNPTDNVGGPLDPNGGTLVYNRRGTHVPDVDVLEAGVLERFEGGDGPLNDPTAMMYVRLEDLEPRWIAGISPDGTEGADNSHNSPYPKDGIDDRCQKFKADGSYNMTPVDPECPVKLKANAPVEPLVIRANAGDCIQVTLHNKLVDQARVRTKAEDAYYGYETSDPSVWYDDNGVDRSLFDRVMAEKLILQGKSFKTGDGKPVPLADIVFDEVPDLAGWQDTFWVVNRHMMNGKGEYIPVMERRKAGEEMHFFNNNLIRPSAHVGLHAQLVEYDASRHDGLVAGANAQDTVAGPRGQSTYRFYAGHIDTIYEGVGGKGRKLTRNFSRRATPVEFGGVNLLSADRVKQPQKGLYGALVIEPQGSTWPDALGDLRLVPDSQGTGTDTRTTRAQATVNAGVQQGPAGDRGTYDESVSVTFRIANLHWKDGRAIANIHQGELGREGAEDSGHAGYNYGTEPSWFRFQLPPDVPFGNAGTPNSFGAIQNVHAFYANGLVKGEPNAVPYINGVSAAGDPATPVFRAAAGQPARMYVLNGASADRDATFVLHGHVWQRDPYVCPGDNYLGLTGLCSPGSIGSLALGHNPVGKYMGGEEGMGHVYGHWPILFNAGGSFAVPGDYLFRDYAPSGARNGMFGILRAEPAGGGSAGGGQ